MSDFDDIAIITSSRTKLTAITTLTFLIFPLMKTLSFSAFSALHPVDYDAFVVLVSSRPNPSDVVFAMVMALFCLFLENSSNSTIIAVFA